MFCNVAANFRQFYLLLWKNLILQIRRPIGTGFELLLPLFAILLVIVLRHAVFTIEDKCFVTFEPDPLELPQVTTVLFYAPNNTEENAIMKAVERRMPATILMNSSSEDMMVAELQRWRQTVRASINTSLNRIRIDSCINGFGIVFNSLDGDNLQYTIRPVHEVDGEADASTWDTGIAQPRFQVPGPRFNPNLYLSEGFLHLQNLVGMSIIERALFNTNSSLQFEEIPVNVKQYPYPPYERNEFLLAINNIMPLLLVLSFIYSAGILVRELVTEKETRLRESMKMMGLSGWILWLTWYLKQFLFLLITIFFMAILVKVQIFVESDFFLILIYLILFVNCLIAWGFLISVFFSRAVIGMLVGFLAWFCNFFPYFFLANRYDELSTGEKVLACFLSNTCMGLGVNVISTLEIREQGVTWGNIGDSVSADDDFNLGIVFIMFIVDSIIYMLIAWYIDAVFPGEYGIPKPFYFFLTPDYWVGRSGKKVNLSDAAELGEMNPNSDSKGHEPEPTGLDIGISIKGLGKVFKISHGTKTAVDSLYLNMYEDQITVLLGHNGAGKTTTMSILVGLYPPTSGDAIINGYSILTDMESIRQSLGLCPQHNILYDRLTVREHLNFFARLKGMSGPGVKEEVDSMIEDLQLTDKANQKSAALSGGQKRKLSVGIALVAGSKFVILDEPTSGMDPYARRATWDLLSKHKNGRTMLLTTHFMDEADLLGDRIAIMAEGQLRCSGSSLFLKSRYGVGYHMVITKGERCDSTAVIQNVSSIVPGGKLTSDVGAELSFILPGTMASQFPFLFDTLEANKKQLGISSFGISITTMEEVFIKVGEKSIEETTDDETGSIKEPLIAGSTVEYDSVVTGDLNTGIVLWFQQSYALLVKRFLHSLRNWRAVITQIILPVIFIILGLVLIETVPGVTTADEKRSLSMTESALLEDNIIAFYAELGNGTSIFKDNKRMEYLYAIGATQLSDISEQVQALVNSTSHQTIVDIADCCGYRYQILDTFCAAQSSMNLKATCTNGDFGYSECNGCLDCRSTYDPHLASCSFPSTRANSFFTADKFCPHPPSVSVTEPLPVTNPQPLDYMSYFVDEYLINQADNNIDTSDFFRRYMAGFVVSRRENLVTRCGVDYTRSVVGNAQGSLDAKDLMCLMIGFTPIVESTEIFTNTSFRQSLISSLQNDTCFSSTANPAELDYMETTACLFFRLTDAYRHNATVKYPECNTFVLTDAYDFIVDQNVTENVSNASYGFFRVDGAVRLASDFHVISRPDAFVNAMGISEDELVGRQYAPLAETTGVTIFYNNQPFHMSAAALNAFHAVYLRHLLEESGATATDYTINVNIHPLPRTTEGKVSAAESSFLGFSLSIIVIFGLSFLAASFILYPVAEKASKAKHIQFVSGVYVTSFWLSAFLWDLINSSIPTIAGVILFAAFPNESYRESIGAVFLLFFFFSWSSIPIVYAFSFLFSNSLIAFALTILLFFFSALFGLVIVFVVNADDAETANFIFVLLPSYAFSSALGQIHTNYVIKDACKDIPMICAERGLKYFDNILEYSYPAIGANILVMAIEGVVFLVLTILIELEFFMHKLAPLCINKGCKQVEIDPDDDCDVVQEKTKISENQQNDDLIQIKNLKKEYRGCCRKVTKHAVKGLSLGIPKGECFGLLGTNGAGKTTTFKMLTGDIKPSSGTATIAGYDIISDIRKVQQHIGYCPQFDALIEDMTAYELLWMYARLRGIPEAKIKRVVDREIERLDLLQHAKNLCGTYSGGNKRKLSTAIALVGSPLIVFLDEPTTGMDPATRRHLWNALISVIKAGKSILLTSHSMEECEALCTRLVIMVNGEFKCLGGIQHLKSKFGKGYTLQVKIKLPDMDPTQINSKSRLKSKSSLPSGSTMRMPTAISNTIFAATETFHSFIYESFQYAKLIEEHQGAITYQLTGDNVTWSQIFRTLETNKEKLLIIDYSVTQTTLEQVFLNFAKVQQYEET